MRRLEGRNSGCSVVKEVGIEYQIPRNVLALLMVAQVAVVLPHIAQLSPWIVAVCGICGLWRTMVYQGRWAFPPSWVKAVFVVAAVIGVTASGASAFSVETASSLLIVSFALKLVEMKTRRDAYVVIFLSYFVIATEFLFSQSLVIALYEVGAAVLVTAAMIGLNQLRTNVRPVASIRLAGALLSQALPLTLVLFVFFPRVAPLWSVPVPSATTTGISDRVTPGDIADLSQSDEIAFRAVFADAAPPPNDLYWRGVVYDRFDGDTWTQSEPGVRLPADRIVPPEQRGAGLSYTLLQEATFATFLFGVATPVPENSEIELRESYTMQSETPLMSLLRYDVTSYPDFVRGAALTEDSGAIQRALQLGEANNPRAREWAVRELQRAGSVNAYVEHVLSEVASKYTYTLKPPILSTADTIDEFWFDTKTGFCAHFAGSFVYLMRAAGIPARMVGGYQGGELNPLTGHIVVRQYDAHAWAEIWQKGVGWRRVDPTFAVAPERIRVGLSAALSADDRSSLSALTNARLNGFDSYNQLLYLFDSLEHRWNMWVVGYDTNAQLDYLTELLGQRPSPTTIAIAVSVGGALSLGFAGLALFLRRPRAPKDLLTRSFLQFCKVAARRGVIREPWESPMAFIKRASTHYKLPAAQVTEVIAGMERLLYNQPAGARQSRLERRRLSRLLRALRWRTIMQVA